MSIKIPSEEITSLHTSAAIDQTDNPGFSKTNNRDTTVINGTVITLGDSLSDGGKKHGKYNQKLSGMKLYPRVFNR
ncbi:hypothetical protein [Rickettsiella endosymbiont of Dermanyssus gallinae]|uniref:hypothetical protein n=1 Tax=Rickettsiella endosymbiont of Dermanyssus gallinae TaxID=2856608 RepID=UPI001C52BB18|nr:hypothetical protein [Rickettsiella endosymbiont of Dermanyssus gallinae]